MTLAVVLKMNFRIETEAQEQLELTTAVWAMNGQGLAGGNGNSQKERPLGHILEERCTGLVDGSMWKAKAESQDVS